MVFESTLYKKYERLLSGPDKQVLFDVGDKVWFPAGARGWQTGTVEKLNPKRAIVKCGATVWDVPYGRLIHPSSSTTEARTGRVARLVDVTDQARDLMDQNGLRDWSLRFNNAQRQLGACHWQRKLIVLSRSHTLKRTPEQVTDTILHEIAHALAGPRAGHGPKWKAIASRLGARPKSCAPEPEGVRKKRQAAKTNVKLGDTVAFRGKKRIQTGIVMRLNPKTARVKCSGSIWLVPYNQLVVLQLDKSDSQEA